MCSIPDAAGYFVVELYLEEADPLQVVAWADEQLAKTYEPIHELISLSTRDFDEDQNMSSTLFSIWNQNRSSISIGMVLGRVFRQLECSIFSGHQACKQVWLILADEERPRQVKEIANELDVRIGYQRPGYFRRDESAKSHYLKILRQFDDC